VIQLKSTQNYGAQQGVKILVYGRAGHGKTTLCATCPAPIIFSAESGLLALARYNLPYAEIRNLAELRQAYQWAKSSAEARQFQTICLDSISEIGEVVLAASKASVKDGRQAYGQMIDQMVAAIKEFRDLPGFHVYMSAKLERMKDEHTGIVTNGPMMPGVKLGQAMPYFPDEVFKIAINDGPPRYHYLQCQPDFTSDAKDRSGRLAAIEEPHLGKIIDKITLAHAA
jgi:hypothetical protein